MEKTKDLNICRMEQWWMESDFKQMERITGFRLYDFAPDEGYQSFVDACDSYWEQSGTKGKIRIWEENNSLN
jgi:hypothetical protein